MFASTEVVAVPSGVIRELASDGEGWEGGCTTGTPLRSLHPGGAPRQRTRNKSCPVVSARMLGKGVQQW
jgi:hypothetical protein